MESTQRKAVYTIIEKPNDKNFWLQIGWGSVNRDGSYSLSLDAFPTNGRLHVRDWQPRERPSSEHPAALSM